MSSIKEEIGTERDSSVASGGAPELGLRGAMAGSQEEGQEQRSKKGMLREEGAASSRQKVSKGSALQPSWQKAKPRGGAHSASPELGSVLLGEQNLQTV